jgi:hypothetical protein
LKNLPIVTDLGFKSNYSVFFSFEQAQLLHERGDLLELVDKRLGSDFNKKEAMVMINVGLLCTNETSNLRPSMSSVVSMLEGRTVVPEFVSESSEVMNEQKLQEMSQYYSQIDENSKVSKSQSRSLSIDDQCTGSRPLDSSSWIKKN